ncbi:MFS-type transporter SLC18B1-like isoform X2 [Halichondria panicea]|uniref:MFS-type transporter SLC18B1-like isoform X2 n=1 Tax=Halichondria panicea TaxID=6063 RepID=UPI00312B3675
MEPEGINRDSHSIQSPVLDLGSKSKATETDHLLCQKSSINSVVEAKLTKRWAVSSKTIFSAVFLWLGIMVVSASYSLFGPFFPGEAADKGASPTMVGVIVSSSPLCVVILAPLIGYLLPRLGLRFTLMAGLWLVGGPFILLGFMSSPQISSGWMFATLCIILRMTEGVGSAMFFTACYALIPELFPNHIGTAVGLFEVATGLGYAIGPPLGGLLYQAGGFSLPFHVMGSISLLFLVPCFFLIKKPDCKAQPLSWKIIKMILSNFTIILLITVNIFSIAAISFLTPSFQPFLSKFFDLDPLYVGLVFLSGPLSYMVFSIVVGPLSDKLGPRGFILFGQILYSVGYIFLGPADFISYPQLWITITAFVVVGCGAAFGMVPIYTDILNLSKCRRQADREIVDLLVRRAL